MRRIVHTVTVILNMIADFIYAPIFRAHMREVAIKFPLFPGQVWLLPRLGRVRIKGTTENSVSYRLMDADDGDDDVYTVSRKDFFLNRRGTEEKDDDDGQKGAVVPFTLVRDE